jgi:phosphate transport system substrate-binding protein
MRTIALLTLVGLISVATAPFATAQKINAAGASFPDPIYEKWFSDYHKLHPDVQISYNPNGSGGGVKGVTDGTIDFGASDPPMSDTELAAVKGKIFHFPSVVGAVVPVYNIPGVTQDLKFTGQTLADIYLNKITKWNDKGIAADNPGVKLPNEDIVPIHRTDNSGTTYVFTDFLSKVSPEWKSKIGFAKGVSWPSGLGGNQDAGVAGLVKNTPNSIGYVELIYAVQQKMGYGSVKNAGGDFIKADFNSVTEAAAATVKDIPEDFRVSITNAPGKKSYPIASYTYLLIPAKTQDAGKATQIKMFLEWMLSEGQKSAQSLDYSPLPASVVAKEKKQLAMVEAPKMADGKKK